MNVTPQTIGAALHVAPNAMLPQAFAGATPVQGGGIDRSVAGGKTYQSCVLSASVGTAAGAPSAQAVTYKLQDSAENITFADYVEPVSGVVPTVALTANNTFGIVNVDLSAARRYVQVVATPAFTGGTSPSLPGEATLIFGGANTQPA